MASSRYDLNCHFTVSNAIQVEDIAENDSIVLDTGTVAIKLEWLKALRVPLITRAPS